jgi:polysaccharide export outer membrane protein
MQPARLGAVILCLNAATLLGTLVLAPPACAQTIETPQQTNERIRAASGAARSAPHDYTVGPGDLISVQVFDVPELSRDVRVSQTGTISLPLVKVHLRAAGLTESQIEQKIAEVLESEGLVTQPQVSVAVKEKKSNPITIVGAVAHPMVYQADGPVTLIEALAQAGGIAADASDTVIVTRPGLAPLDDTADANPREPPAISPQDVAPADSNPAKPPAASQTPSSSNADTITVNLNELLEGGNTRSNIPLRGGDIVTVPHAGIIYVLGAVKKPGGYVVSNDRMQLTALKVLSLAGGLDNAAKSEQAIIVRRDGSGQQHEVPLNLKRVMKLQSEDVRLEPSDVLVVPKSGAREAMLKTAALALTIGSSIAIFRLAYR